MASGATSAQQIMRAYLDRIAAYDGGPLGLHSVITVAPDAMAQAKAADDARAAGDTRPLLGIPILAKDIFDTKDMPTTGGSLVFAGYRPTKDAWMVAKLREAGAIIMGKANLAEFATDGHFSPSASGQVWNAFDPVEVLDRLLRRVRGRGRLELRRGRPGHADRRLAVGPVERRLAGVAARHRRHAVDRRRDATHLRAGLRGRDQPHAAGPRAAAQRDRRSTRRAIRSTTSPTGTGPRTGRPRCRPARWPAR